jgi:uncharacterized DUF497 family protein
MHTIAFVDIEFDPAKARANLRNHRVSFADAEQALRDPQAVTIEDPDAEGERGLSRWAPIRWGACWSWSIRCAAIESG